ncbi:MAG: TMEM165/GDT1 family protein [Kiritimatiellaeota bacterium]|nr:TMEM165/GDT1 family protein [Kiritimatiellota bacterium]
MDYKTLLMVFGSVFIAELGDKTQLATLLFASDKKTSRLVVFIGASLALIATSAVAVFAGDLITKFVTEKQLSIAAGIGFIAIGIWTLVKA